jgi:HrpA-like RNA helicase
MPHVIFGGEDEPEAANAPNIAKEEQAPVASTSKLPDSPAPAVAFKQKKDKKKRQASISSDPTAKKVRTFYDNDGDDDDDAEEVASLGPALQISGGVAESKKQARQRQQKERQNRAEHLLNDRMKLPVWFAKDAILQEIDQLDTVVVLGETGSGKTTR